MSTTPHPDPRPTSTTSPDAPTPDTDRPLVDATGRIPAGRRALVLGGGGSAGNAWLIGVVAGLVDAGLDVTDADLVIGTSAGATAAAQITSATPAELFAQTVQGVPPRRPAPVGPEPGRVPARPAANPVETLLGLIDASRSPADYRRRICAATRELEAASDGSGTARWRAVVTPRLPRLHWPERAVLLTAIDADTADPVVFDRHSGVELVDAVAASTSNGLGSGPYRIGDHRYLDGGYRRNENADLAAGYERVLVLSPLGGRTLTPLEWGQQLAVQVDELRASGSTVETILPDARSLAAFGDNMMDPTTRPPAARAGHDQGRALAGALSDFWI
ncbi:patatin [Cellulomonas chitinilytica]|uniref:Patatin n=1 Tax=Cellulomonas chitinilytica TaxID=398759 RepID=A0A919U2M8_9CELL|nr:patatin-like phospholipase family protein [Cellulomonas chitinilytica]GIG22491.1 patatin [Cellulomonas chitinilytica]